MPLTSRRSLLRRAALLPFAAARLTAAHAQAASPAGQRHRLAIQVTDNDPARWRP